MIRHLRLSKQDKTNVLISFEKKAWNYITLYELCKLESALIQDPEFKIQDQGIFGTMSDVNREKLR